jgi:geranylgeranyl pyrophosphate synthase
MRQLTKNIGIAFQILNDLKDWQGDDDNKLQSGCDVAGGRPTLLLALALEGLSGPGQEELLGLLGARRPPAELARRVHAMYEGAGVFEKADRLVDQYEARAQEVAAELEPDELRRLCHYLIDTILQRPRVVACAG